MSTIQASPFEPRTIYDAPETLFSMAIDGELTSNGIRSALFDPQKLTPKEMDGFRERLKAAAGGHSVSNALVDLATNPWVWFFMLTGPVAAEAGSLFKLAKNLHPAVRANASVLAPLGMLTSQQVLRDTAVGAAVHRAEEGLRTMLMQPQVVKLYDVLDDVVAANGLHPEHRLDWTRYRDPMQAQKARTIATALEDALAGADKAGRKETFVRWNAKNGAYQDSRTLPRELASSPDALLEQFGATGLRDAARDAMKARAKAVFKDEEAVLRIYRMMQHAEGMPGGDAGGKQLVRGLLGEFAEKVTTGKVPYPEFKKAVRVVLSEIDNPNYMPRNVVETFLNGKPVTGAKLGEARWAAGVSPSRSTVGRTSSIVLRHPEDYAFRQQMYGEEGVTDYFREQSARASKAMDSGKQVRFFRTRPQESFRRYFDSMARTYAVAVQDIGGEVRAVNRATRSSYAEVPHKYGKGLAGQGGVSEAIDDIEATGRAPAGGFSLADVLSGEQESMAGDYARRTVSQVVVPHLMGWIPTEHAALNAGLLRSKELAGWFAKSPAGESIARNGGKVGEKFIGGLAEFAARDLEPGTAGRIAGGALRTLYASHLSNVGSAIINGTQPFTFAGSWLGYGNVLKGYGRSFKELSGYLGERGKQGFKALNWEEKHALITKHFRYADEIGLTPDVLDQLEGGGAGVGRSMRAVTGKGERWAFEYPLKLFEKFEWMNRSTVAHAVESKWASQGKAFRLADDALDPLFQNEMRQVVQETQFGNHWMNTPIAFLPGNNDLAVTGKLLSNGLTRQFSSFALRSFTAFAHTGTVLAGREGVGRLTGTLRDAVRGMGFSALMYELGKDLAGMDLSRGGYYSGVTEFIPGFSNGRYDDRENGIGLPPVADIPISLARGIIGADFDLVERTIPRMVPWGSSLSKLAQIAPRVPLPDPFNLQQTYADWRNPDQNGRIAVYKGDGSLIEWRDKADLVLKGVGADMGRFSEPGSVAKVILNNSDTVRELRRQATVALVTNDLDRFESVRKEFTKRIGVPLVITAQQVEAQRRALTTSRLDRIVQRSPDAIRPQLAEKVAATRERRGWGEEAAPRAVPFEPYAPW